MLFETKQTHDSFTHPDVRFTVRRLNVIQRAARDARVMSERLQYTIKIAELRQLTKELVPAAVEDPKERLKVLAGALDANPEKSERYMRLEHAANCIRDEHLVPATIRAALIEVEHDGRKVTPAEFLESAPDDLLLEVYDRCEEASGLTADEQKNSQSPGTSAGQATQIPNGNAGDAAQSGITEAATADSTFPS